MKNPRSRLRGEPDPRFKTVCEFYCEESRRRFGAYQWDGSDGKALAALLKSQPQINVDRWKLMLVLAFTSAEKSRYCPVKLGFRFREFAANFVKIAARMPQLLRQEPDPMPGQIRRLMTEKSAYRELIPPEKRHDWWDEICCHYLGITAERAKQIMDADEAGAFHKPMRPDWTGD